MQIAFKTSAASLRASAVQPRYLSARGALQPTWCARPRHNTAVCALGFPATVFQAIRGIMGAKDDFQVSPEQKWWTTDTVAIVTGANKGIGKAAAQLLAQNGLKTIVAARDESRGTEAVKELQQLTGLQDVHFEQLDISDPASVSAFAQRVGDKYDRVAILINNAGFAYKGNVFGAEEARTTLDINFVGTRAVCEAVLPLMTEGGRIVNVCSMAGKQRIIKDSRLLRRFQDAKDVNEVAKLADEFVEGIQSGRYKAQGWPGSMYGVSKLCEATYTRVLAEQTGTKLDVNACCPGWVDTDMSSHRGVKTPLQGADTPVWLALLAPKGTSGKFFSDRREEAF